MEKKFSIVIPSYNCAKPIMLTLTSLELQTFPSDRFEVIVVNDASDDGTDEVMKTYTPPYSLIYIKNDTRQGRAFTRNAGVKRAQGRYLVFLDADFLVVPEFLEVLNTYNHKYPNHVISGFPHSLYGAFTQYYPHFSNHQKKKMRRILEPNGLWDKSWLPNNLIVDIVTPDDLRRNFRKLLSVILPSRLSKIDNREFMSTDVAPWLMFITRCVSVKRRHFMEVGGFQERFIKYGIEDWELGYRLHKHGLSYRSMNQIIGYHQEHPSTIRKDDPELNNLRMFYDIHGTGDPELALLSICHPWKDPQLYKTLLRELKKWKSRDDEYSKLGGVMEKALHQSAKAFIGARIQE
ncbi:glycosyltransferase family 2 protein [Paenibacillus sp. N3.4]|uniref:glycosyltransferase family 2 protein n=1 Tax=Paenibacillus sp. N3.4 TaxID=2603222 RepID=UPI0011CCB1FE|nr:glycosyltransferase family 2 protein [Paenibacillus sp. N3.4]TXK79819.1 glycosyltransferase family 2 protein [Paenibacillus sp. N3.4]